MDKKRPIYLALHLIRLPLPGLVSILHRISGMLLFMALPLLLLMLQYSLGSVESYTELTSVLQNPFIKLILLVLLWAFLHHLCAGMRYLAIDMDCCAGQAQANASSRWVLFVSLGLTVLIGMQLW